MTALVHPKAAARVKAAFDLYELVARTRARVRRGPAGRPAPESAPARSTMIYDGGTVRVVADGD